MNIKFHNFALLSPKISGIVNYWNLWIHFGNLVEKRAVCMKYYQKTENLLTPKLKQYLENQMY